MGLASNVVILLATVAIASVVADTDLSKAAEKATTIEDGSMFCPVPVIGKRYDTPVNHSMLGTDRFQMSGRVCIPLLQVLRWPEQGLLLQPPSLGYVSNASKRWRLDEWVLCSVVLAVIAFIIIAGCVLSILRCLFCRK
jgi:hypothetical protein